MLVREGAYGNFVKESQKSHPPPVKDIPPTVDPLTQSATAISSFFTSSFANFGLGNTTSERKKSTNGK